LAAAGGGPVAAAPAASLSPMRIDPAGWPFVGVTAGVAVIAGLSVNLTAGGVLVVAAGLVALFFRDPERVVTAERRAVLAPADGRVMAAGASTSGAFPAARWQQVTVFLSPFDVHVNRMPVAGTVTSVEFHPGRFLPAYRREAGDLNEYTEVRLDHDGRTVVVRQVVGVMARRIVCRVKKGDVVKAGDRFGVMKFGSRMDVFIPADSIMHARVGQRAIAGVTVLATLASSGAPGGRERDGQT
jgi:phosphatidylserine decarboxylase